MARRRTKHSQWSEVLAENQKRSAFFRKHGRDPIPPGYGLSYDFLPLRPNSPLIAYFFRRFISFYDALRDWRVQLPPHEVELPEHERRLVPRADETIRFRRDAADRILASLEEPSDQARSSCENPEVLRRLYGGSKEKCLAHRKSLRDNYETAGKVLEEWCRDAKREAGEDENAPVTPRWPKADGGNPLEANPKLRVAWELENVVNPLLWAYRDPARFFREIAPELERPLFDQETVGPFKHFAQTGGLGQLLYCWGIAALFNPTVRAALDAATPEKLLHILGEADAKDCYREGPPPGATKGKPKSGRPRRPFGELSDRSKEQRLYRQGSRKRKK